MKSTVRSDHGTFPGTSAVCVGLGFGSKKNFKDHRWLLFVPGFLGLPGTFDPKFVCLGFLTG